MGSFAEDWTELYAKDKQQHGLYRVTGYGDFMLANRVSFEMDFMGPSMVIRTGCSAALVASTKRVWRSPVETARCRCRRGQPNNVSRNECCHVGARRTFA